MCMSTLYFFTHWRRVFPTMLLQGEKNYAGGIVALRSAFRRVVCRSDLCSRNDQPLLRASLFVGGRQAFTTAAAALMCVVGMSNLQKKPCPELEEYHLTESLKGPISQDDPALLRWIRRQLVPPSTLPYNLSLQISGLQEEHRPIYSPSQELISENVFHLLDDTLDRGGRFVEAGAYDGEFLSNTLWMEKEFGWRGLLVEANPIPFSKLLLKRRRSWAINACLNTKPYPSKELFTRRREKVLEEDLEKQAGNASAPSSTTSTTESNLEGIANLTEYYILKDFFERHKDAASSRMDVFPMKPEYKEATIEVQCLPLYSILSALGWNHVDFLSLDLEKAELGVLKTLPWDKVSFKVLAIEHVTQEDLVGFLKERGYELYVSGSADNIFVNVKHFDIVYEKASTTSAIPRL